MINEPDSSLFQRAARGDRDAFALLITRHWATALRQARAALRTDETAREVVQEATLRAFLAIDRLQSGERFAAWFGGITRNVINDFRRQLGRAPLSWDAPEVETFLPTVPDTLRLVEAREDARTLDAAIAGLPAASRDAVHLFYQQGFSVAETAEALNTTPGAVRVRLHDGRSRLRATLRPEPVSAAPKRSRKMVPVELLALRDLGKSLREPFASQAADPLASAENARVFLLAAINGLPPHSLGGVFLYDASGERALSVRVGQVTAVFIAGGGKPDKHQPQPYETLSQLLSLLGSHIEDVTLDVLPDAGYFGELRLKTPSGTRTLRVKPTDGLALAARLRTPILVPSPVLERDAWPLTDAQAVAARLLSSDTEAASQEPFLMRLADGFIHQQVGNVPYARENLGDRFGGVETVRLEIAPYFNPPHALVVWERHHILKDNKDEEYGWPLAFPLSLYPALITHLQTRTEFAPLIGENENGKTITLRFAEAS